MAEFVRDVTESTFQDEVVERSRQLPVVVDFWAPWCGPCRQLGRVLEELAAAGNGAWMLAKVNADEAPKLSQEFGVRGIPQVLAFVDGQVVEQFTGALPKSEVERWIAKIVPTEVDLIAREAVAAARDGDQDLELSLWTRALAADAAYHVARVRRARILLSRGQLVEARTDLEAVPQDSPFHEEAGNLLQLADWSIRVAERGGLYEIRDRAAEDPDRAEARYDFGCALAVKGQFADALAEFLEVVKRDREFEDDAGRRAMLALFAFLGERHALTSEFRGLLARAMN